MIVLIIVLFILLFIVWKYLSMDNFDMTRINSRDWIKKVNTGDIIGVCYNSVPGRLVNLFSNSYWTHLSMVVKKENIYIFEVCYYKSFRGVHMILLDEWLKKNSDFEISWISKRGKRIDYGDVEKIYEKLKQSDINLFVPSWLISLVKQKYEGNEAKDKYFCSEFIVMVMQELGVMRKIFRPCNYTPNEIMLSKIELEDDHLFDEPKIISFS